jgi:hypothetical protein
MMTYSMWIKCVEHVCNRLELLTGFWWESRRQKTVGRLMWISWVENLSHMKKNRFPSRVLVGNLKTRNRLEDLSIDLSIILKHLEEAVWEGVDLIHLAQDRDQWQDLVNIVMSFEVS